MSVCSSIGWMRSSPKPKPSPPPAVPVGISVMIRLSAAFYRCLGVVVDTTSDLDIEEADVFRVALDEGAPLLDVLAHEDREDLVGLGGVLEADLLHQAGVGVHRGLPQLVGVHLAEALVALDRVLLGQLLALGQPVGEQRVAL